MPPHGTCRQCGLTEIEGRTCTATFHELLAREQQSPELAAYHGIVVPCYFLQHSGDLPEAMRDVQWRMLQLFAERGIEALHRVQHHLRRMNSHRRHRPLSFSVLDDFEALPNVSPPRSFDVSVAHLAGPDGSFPVEGYDRRVRALVDATLRAWRHAGVHAGAMSARYAPNSATPE
jgi:hypothetical protein